MYRKIKTSRGIIKLIFKASSVIEDDKEVPKYMKLDFSNCHWSGSLKEIQKKYEIPPNLMKKEIDHNAIIISIYKNYEN